MSLKSNWKSIDLSETLVLSQNQLTLLNENINKELKKRAQTQSLKALEKDYKSKFEAEESNKSMKRVSKIVKKVQKTEEAISRLNESYEKKYQDFINFVKGEHDLNKETKVFVWLLLNFEALNLILLFL